MRNQHLEKDHNDILPRQKEMSGKTQKVLVAGSTGYWT